MKDSLIGVEVDVFEDPFTRQKPEGRAVILARRDTEDYYTVRFVDDGFVCDRFLYHLENNR